MTPHALVDRLRRLSPAARGRILGRLSARELAALRWIWIAWARPDVRDPADPRTGTGQLPPPGDWQWWANIGGRGSGKTTSCAHWINEEALRLGRGCIVHLVGQSIDDARATMVEGPSGLLATAPPWAGIDFKASVEGGTLAWRSGAVGRVFGADKPRKGRGPQCNRMWLDDPAAFGKHGKDTLDQLLLGFRMLAPDGSGPRGVISSTPIDSELLRWILAGEHSERQSDIVYSKSATDDNRANLAPSFFRTLAEFAGTELEQQERFGMFVSSTSGKVFAGIDFSQAPIRAPALPADIRTIAVWVDPATSSSAAHSCEVGIVVVAADAKGHVYGIDDRSAVMSATEWPGVVIDCVERWSPVAPTHVGIEINKGGNMGPELIASADRIRRLQAGLPGTSVLEIRTAVAKESKAQRGAPLVRLARSGFLHLLPGLTALERQLRDLDDSEGPKRDRADAFVWGVLDLAGAETGANPAEQLEGLATQNESIAASMPHFGVGGTSFGTINVF